LQPGQELSQYRTRPTLTVRNQVVLAVWNLAGGEWAALPYVLAVTEPVDPAYLVEAWALIRTQLSAPDGN